MRVDCAAHLYGRCACQQAFDNIFPVVYSGRGGDADSGYLAGDNGCPAQRIAQVGMVAEYVTGYDLHIVDVDVRLVETVKEDDTVCTVYRQRMGKCRNISDHFAYFDHHRNGNGFLDFTDDADIQVAHVFTAVVQIRL